MSHHTMLNRNGNNSLLVLCLILKAMLSTFNVKYDVCRRAVHACNGHCDIPLRSPFWAEAIFLAARSTAGTTLDCRFLQLKKVTLPPSHPLAGATHLRGPFGMWYKGPTYSAQVKTIPKGQPRFWALFRVAWGFPWGYTEAWLLLSLLSTPSFPCHRCWHQEHALINPLACLSLS